MRQGDHMYIAGRLHSPPGAARRRGGTFGCWVVVVEGSGLLTCSGRYVWQGRSAGQDAGGGCVALVSRCGEVERHSMSRSMWRSRAWLALGVKPEAWWAKEAGVLYAREDQG